MSNLPQMYDYNGYRIMVAAPVVSVLDWRFSRTASLYETTSLDLAAKWIDAYRAGEAWAVAAKAG